MANRYFGTDGIRGVAGEYLTPGLACRAAFGFAQQLSGERYGERRRPQVAIGWDSRLSSPMLSLALASGLSFGGCDPVLLGCLPTPLVPFTVLRRKLAGGAMVTASHNPIQDNGIKLFGADGFKISPVTEMEIENVIDQPSLTVSNELHFGTHIEYDPRGQYLSFLRGLDRGRSQQRSLRIVLDCAYGATCGLAPPAFEQCGFDVVATHARFDGRRVNVGSGATDLSSLQKRVRREKADLGLAFDGDGDRMLAVDEQGQAVNGDKIIALLALHLPRYRKSGAAVMTQMTNMGIERQLRQQGIKLVRTDVGDVLVMRELLRRKLLLGGEQSGHIIMRDLLPGGDGILAGLQLARLLRTAGRPLSDLAGRFAEYPQQLTNLRVADKHAWQRDKGVIKRLREVERRFPQVRFYLRPSGTEPLIRVLTEAPERELCLAGNEAACQVLAGGGQVG